MTMVVHGNIVASSNPQYRLSTMVTIDPGISGAVAVLQIELGEAHAGILGVLDLFDMPLRQDPEGKNHVDFRGLTARLAPYEAEWGVIELQHAMRQQSSTSAWKQAEVYRDAFCALQVSTQAVLGEHGRVWKPKLGLTAVKNASLALARKTFPSAGSMLKRQKDEGRAEALLLGLYACEHFLNQPAIATV